MKPKNEHLLARVIQMQIEALPTTHRAAEQAKLTREQRALIERAWHRLSVLGDEDLAMELCNLNDEIWDVDRLISPATSTQEPSAGKDYAMVVGPDYQLGPMPMDEFPASLDEAIAELGTALQVPLNASPGSQVAEADSLNGQVESATSANISDLAKPVVAAPTKPAPITSEPKEKMK